MAVRFTGANKRIDDIDLPRIGHRIGVGEDEIHAVIDVEASGSGFDRRGRLKMLFEPHIFWRELGNTPARNRAAREGLAYPDWRGGYPADSYPRLEAAMRINETAALRSASWGLGQIMGFNHKAAGYPTVQAMIDDFVKDEDNQLEAMINFIVSKNLDRHIREHRWDLFAHGYNGAQYAVHGYHKKLASRFAHWKAIRDTPFTPGDGEDQKPRDAEVVARQRDKAKDVHDLPGDVPDDEQIEQADEEEPLELNAREIKVAQSALKQMGYHEVGAIDGKWGSRTVAALTAFQHDRGIRKTGELDVETSEEIEAALEEPFKRPIAPERANGVPEGSRIIDGSNKGLGASAVAVITGLLTQLGSWLKENFDFISKVYDSPVVVPFRTLVTDNFGLILIILFGIAAWQFFRIRKARIEDHQKGELA